MIVKSNKGKVHLPQTGKGNIKCKVDKKSRI